MEKRKKNLKKKKKAQLYPYIIMSETKKVFPFIVTSKTTLRNQ